MYLTNSPSRSECGTVTSYEHDAPPVQPRPPLRRSIRTEACIVGGGYTGLSAALHLAEAGLDVVVLEADRIGRGPSGINGGQLLAGFVGPLERLISERGEQGARALWHLVEDGKSAIAERIEDHQIDARLRWGYIRGAIGTDAVRELEAVEASRRQLFGYRCELLDRKAIQAFVRTELYDAARLDWGSGHLDPLRWVRGLADAAERAGARIFEMSPVESVRSTRVLLHGGAAVSADNVFVAANASSGRLLAIDPPLTLDQSWILATRTLANELNALVPGGVAIGDTSGARYARPSAEGRLLYGSDLAARDARIASLVQLFPSLLNVKVQFEWSGTTATPSGFAPAVGLSAPGVWHACGFAGKGLVTTYIAGRAWAKLVAGDPEDWQMLKGSGRPPFDGGLLASLP